MRIFLVLLLNLMLIACEVQRESIEESVLDFGNSSNKTIHSSLLPTDGENYLPYMRSNVAQQILYAIDPNRSAVYQIPLPLSFTAKLPIYHVEYNTDYVEVEARHVSMTDLVLVSDGSLFRVSFQKDKQLLTHQIGSNTNIVHVCEWKQLSFTSPKLVYAKVLLKTVDLPNPKPEDCDKNKGEKADKLVFDVDSRKNDSFTKLSFVSQARKISPVYNRKGSVSNWLIERLGATEDFYEVRRYSSAFGVPDPQLLLVTIGNMRAQLKDVILFDNYHYVKNLSEPNNAYFRADSLMSNSAYLDVSPLFAKLGDRVIYNIFRENGVESDTLRQTSLVLGGSNGELEQSVLYQADSFEHLSIVAKSKNYIILQVDSQLSSEAPDRTVTYVAVNLNTNSSRILYSAPLSAVNYVSAAGKFLYLTLNEEESKNSYVIDLSDVEQKELDKNRVNMSMPSKVELLNAVFATASYDSTFVLNGLTPETTLEIVMPVKTVLLYDVDESLEFKTTKIYDAVNYEMISENTGAAVYPVYSKEFAGRIESFFGVPNTNSALVVAEDNSAEVKVLHLDETAKEDTLIFRDALRVIF